jgi:multiple sugar transport system permease protein
MKAARVFRHLPRRGPRASDASWAAAFLVPYLGVFAAFVVFPIAYALWLGSGPELYQELAQDPHFLTTIINTLLFVGIGVNVKMFLALLLSGFFIRPGWWAKALLSVFVLPWALPALPAFLAMHWMLNGQWGFLNSLLLALFGIEGPIWFNTRWLALGVNIASYIWKWLPFWTIIFMAGRMAIPIELWEAAAVDGATGYRRFIFITFPLLANLYLICTMLSTIWALGDFTTVYFVSGGAPARSSDVLATLGMREAFTLGEPALGIAVVLSALPVLIPLVILLMRRIRIAELQL